MERHRVDLLSLFAGMLFVVAGLLLLSGGPTGLPMQWIGPVVAIGLGLVIIAAARPERPHPEDETPPEQQP